MIRVHNKTIYIPTNHYSYEGREYNELSGGEVCLIIIVSIVVWVGIVKLIKYFAER